MIRAGTALVDITPPAGLALSGSQPAASLRSARMIL